MFAHVRLVLHGRQVIDLGRDNIHTPALNSGFMRPEGQITAKQGSYRKQGLMGLTLE